jgi:Uma2 family endonuclease
MNFALSHIALPMRVRFEHAMSDDELQRFCAANELLRIERDSNGELIVMSPNNAEGSSFEVDVLLELGNWARADGRGKVFGSSAGFTLPDNSMRAPDASWISLKRWNALTASSAAASLPSVPSL